MRKTKKRRQLTNKRKRFLIANAFLALFLFLGIGYTALSSNLNIFGNITVKEYLEPTLYNVLKKATKEGYAKEYTDAHQDSFTEEPSEKIYHWYSGEQQYDYPLAKAISKMNNVIFADQCWKMVRTTDTGGVKLLYNGEAEDGKCLDSRENHIGYDGVSIYDLSDNYYYGSSYTFDKENGLFSLSGNVTRGGIEEGKYTCLETSETGTCTTLKLILRHDNGNYYYLADINNNSYYNIFGSIPYEIETGSPSYVGYMHKNINPMKSMQPSKSISTTSYPYPDFLDLNYAETITYDQNTSKYIATNVMPVSTLPDYNDLVGKYIIWNNGDSAWYVTEVNTSYLKALRLFDGDLTIQVTIGDSYTNNGDGTYTLTNPTLVNLNDWQNNYKNYKNKYLCDDDNTTCENIKHIVDTSSSDYDYWGIENKYKYSRAVEYNNGIYTLTNDIIDQWDPSLTSSPLNSHHYTCLNSSTSCSTVYYFYSYGKNISESSSSFFYIELHNGEGPLDILNSMINSDDVNTRNSIIKTAIDAWYKRYLISHTSYLEDTIFCNDRSLNSFESWDPNNNGLGGPDFKQYESGNSSLICENNTDRFSIANNKAHLEYPIGLLTSSEKELFQNIGIVDGQSSEFWLGTPSHNDSYGSYVYTTGLSQNLRKKTKSNAAIRPLISLKPGIKYFSGNGSKEEPYYVGEVYNILSNSDLVPKESPPGYIVKLGNEMYEVTSFRLNGTLVDGDSFKMPDSDVSITDVQYNQIAYLITNTDNTISVPRVGRVGSNIELKSNRYTVTSFKLNGNLINGNSFIMPAENVTLTNIQKIEGVTIESEHNPYSNRENYVTYYENTFYNATSITVELTYETESTSYDWVYLYDDPNSSTTFNNKKYGGRNLTTETITIPSNYIKIGFRTDGSGNDYYGFKAVITPNYD